jgi:hypothetical protein
MTNLNHPPIRNTLIDKSLKERFLEFLADPKDNLRAKLIQAVSDHQGWEESAVALVDEAIIPAISQHQADMYPKLPFSIHDDGQCIQTNGIASEMRLLSEQERSERLKSLTQKLPDLPDNTPMPWIWSEDEIAMLRAACTKRFDEILRTESLFCIAMTGIRIFLSRSKPEPVSGKDAGCVDARANIFTENNGLTPPVGSNPRTSRALTDDSSNSIGLGDSEWAKEHFPAPATGQPVGLTTLPKQLAQDIYAELFDEAAANYGPEVSKQDRISKITNRILKHVLHFWPCATERESGNDMELFTLKVKIAARAWQILEAHQDDRAMLAHTISKEILELCDQPNALERIKEQGRRGSDD